MEEFDHPLGYQCEFIDSVLDNFYCKRCSLVARRLTFTSCCGESYCHACLADIQQQNKPCPECRHQNFTIMKPLKYQRQMDCLKVNCSMRGRGCSWSGRLGQLDAHLDPNQNNCQHVDIKCPLNCQKTIPRNNVEQHLSMECIKRDKVCQYCDFKAAYDVMVNTHWPKCSYFPLKCPNFCGVTCERDVMEDHMGMCRLEEVTCDFSGVGCDGRFRREDQEEHARQNNQNHLTMTAVAAVKMNQKLLEQVKKLQKQEEKQQGQEVKLQEQEVKLQGQEQKLQEQEVKMQEQEVKLQEQEVKLEGQEQRQQNQEEKLQEQEVKLQEREVKLQGQEEKLQGQEEKLQQQEEKLQEHEKSFQEQKCKLQEEKQKTKKELRQQEQKFEEKELKFRKLLLEQDKKFVKLQVKSDQNEVVVKEVTNFINLKRTFAMENFSKEKAKDKPCDWKSPGMYTHICGYKFCIGIDANGCGLYTWEGYGSGAMGYAGEV